MEDSNRVPPLETLVSGSLSRYESSRQEIVREKVSQKKLQLETFNQIVFEEAAEKFRLIQHSFITSALEKIRAHRNECEAIIEEVNRKESQFEKRRDKKPFDIKLGESISSSPPALNNQIPEIPVTASIKVESYSPKDETMQTKNFLTELVSSSIANFPNIELEDESKVQEIKYISENECDKTVVKNDLVKKPMEPQIPPQEKQLREALNLQKFCSDFEAGLQDFVNNRQMKGYITDLQLFMRTLVNTISQGSFDQIRQKASQLHNLLSGKSVYFQDKTINCNQHPKARDFCIFSLSKTFINVGTKQIASLSKAAFPMGATIAMIWSHHEPFGKLFFGLIQEKCPYGIPYYPAKNKNDSETNYLIACGYNFAKDGQTMESDESFTSRMRSMTMLLAAALQSPVPSKTAYKSIDYAWCWLALLLNEEPRPMITAAVLQAFLHITAFRLMQCYNKQFKKLIIFIRDIFLPKVQSVTGKDVKRQTLVQLQLFIEDCFKNLSATGRIEEPDGYIRSLPSLT